MEEKDDRAISKSLIGNLELDYKFHFLPDLHAHVNGGMDLSTGKQYTDVSPYSSTNNYYGSYGWEQKDKYNLSLNAYLQYSKDFTDKHRFDVMAGYEWQHFHDTSDQEYWGLYPLSNNVVENRGQRYRKLSCIFLRSCQLHTAGPLPVYGNRTPGWFFPFPQKQPLGIVPVFCLGMEVERRSFPERR